MAKKSSGAKKSSESSSKEGVIHACDEDFDQILTDHPLCVVDFFASWCPPCRTLAKAMEKTIIPHFAGKNVTFIKVDTDEACELSQRFEIDAVPRLMFWKNGEPAQFDFPNDDGIMEKTEQIDSFADFLTEPIIKVIEQLLV